jgi:hypothetical protein
VNTSEPESEPLPEPEPVLASVWLLSSPPPPLLLLLPQATSKQVARIEARFIATDASTGDAHPSSRFR